MILKLSSNYILVTDSIDKQFKTTLKVEVSGECRTCPNFPNCLHKIFENGCHGVDDQMGQCYKSQDDELENFSSEEIGIQEIIPQEPIWMERDSSDATEEVKEEIQDDKGHRGLRKRST